MLGFLTAAAGSDDGGCVVSSRMNSTDCLARRPSPILGIDGWVLPLQRDTALEIKHTPRLAAGDTASLELTGCCLMSTFLIKR